MRAPGLVIHALAIRARTFSTLLPVVTDPCACAVYLCVRFPGSGTPIRCIARARALRATGAPIKARCPRAPNERLRHAPPGGSRVGSRHGIVSLIPSFALGLMCRPCILQTVNIFNLDFCPDLHGTIASNQYLWGAHIDSSQEGFLE